MTVTQMPSSFAVGSRVDLAQLSRYQAEGLVKGQRHPSLDLTIWNYTPKCQWERAWDDVTMTCRGLVTNDDGKIVARPFRKFFNLDEHEALFGPLPDEPFTVYEKLDGSLIILFRYQGQTVVASRGSFTSPQAEKARSLLRGLYGPLERQVTGSVTYCLEVIYPDNRIVVDYGRNEALVLLAMFDTATGAEQSRLFDIGFPLPRLFLHDEGFRDLPAHPNEEGYVLRFQGGVRVKVKNAEYVRLHRLLTQTTPKAIWEAMRDGTMLSDVLDRVPDEFYQWVRTTIDGLQARHNDLLLRAAARLALIDADAPRAEIAEQIKREPAQIRPLMFMLLDGKDADALAWRLVKPSGNLAPFRRDDSVIPPSP